MELYNMTKLVQSQDVGDLALTANSYSGGVIFGGGSLAVFIIVLVLLTRNPNSEFANSLLVASFVSFVLAGILAFGEYLSPIFSLGYLILMALTGLFIWTTKS